MSVPNTTRSRKVLNTRELTQLGAFPIWLPGRELHSLQVAKDLTLVHDPHVSKAWTAVPLHWEGTNNAMASALADSHVDHSASLLGAADRRVGQDRGSTMAR